MVKTIVLAGVAAAILAGVAIANEPSLPRGERMFKRLDSDGNGKITLAEIGPKASKRFLRMDGDSDGTVTAAEIDTFLKQRIEKRRQRMLDRMDADKNGAVTQAELEQFVQVLFKEADTDQDGGVTLAEARAFKISKLKSLRVEDGGN
jgi:Ca2+-binding EF-hand superfamily protein